jgi:hypothetical protein
MSEVGPSSDKTAVKAAANVRSRAMFRQNRGENRGKCLK